MKRALLIVVTVVFAAAVVGWWHIRRNPEAWSWAREELEEVVSGLGLEREPETNGVGASGFIEADKASVSTEMGGRIVALGASEGDLVSEGQVLVELDGSLLLAQLKKAKADLGVAEAALALVRAGVREETLAYAEAQLVQAKAAQEAARVAWEDAEAMLESPQELELARTAARAELNVLRHRAAQAEALANAAQEGRNLSDEIVATLEEMAPFLPSGALPAARYEQALATYQSWVAWTGAEQAETAMAGAERYLEELDQQRADPLDLQAEVNAAKAQYEVAAAAVELAQAQVEGLKMGATPEQVAAAGTQLDAVRSALATLEVNLGKLALRAPISGIVLERHAHVGEVAVPGVPLLILADLDDLTLTVYVPEGQLGEVWLGQPVSVTVDAYPGRVFAGAVVFISDRAEFTPEDVLTQAERVNMVFAVKVKLPNPDHALRPGMPADAVLYETVQ